MGLYDWTCVTQPSDIPLGESYAIAHFSSITIPGDERSKTHPGHGYPEYSQNTTDLRIYKDKTAWEAEITRLTNNRYSSSNWAALILRRPNINSTVTITID